MAPVYLKTDDGKLEVTETVVSKMTFDRDSLGLEKEMYQNQIVDLERRIAEIDVLLIEYDKLFVQMKVKE